MYKIAAIGDKDSIYGFASLGITIFPEEEAQAAAKTIRNLAENGYAVIYITEQLAAQLEMELERYHALPLPAIVPIPGIQGNNGMGLARLSKFVEQAVGSDILSGS